ncbi:MAG: hypothetical protein HG424_000860 [candidate division SR1 bacterium]|nr:hypothetical protein [candidate division SR1 bacterium]
MTREELNAILQKEGNYKAFEYKGYKCRILRMGEGMDPEYRMFHLCGYVLLTKEDRCYGKEYDTIPYTIHGGFTYSSHRLHNQPEEGWRIGFDCAHACDISLPYQLNSELSSAVYRTMDYVEEELKRLVDQIVADRG